jgi:hypothetical protein
MQLNAGLRPCNALPECSNIDDLACCDATVMMERWIWRNFGLTVPSDWEMLQFSRDPGAGRCAFADRYEFRLELDWRVVPGSPDFDRMTADYLARLREQGMKDGSRSRRGGWHGVQGTLEGRPVTRLGRYFSAESCLVEFVFLWPGRIDAALLTKVAESVSVEPPHRDGCRRWRGFGMDLLAGKDLRLEQCNVQPANVEMTFSDAKRPRERFARRGMVRVWLDRPLDAWLRGWIDRDAYGVETTTADVAGHQVCRLTAKKTLPGIRRRLAPYDAAAWLCPADHRLYSVACTGPRGGGGVDGSLAGQRLACCDRLKLELKS